jgi:hypothetical protein
MRLSDLPSAALSDFDFTSLIPDLTTGHLNTTTWPALVASLSHLLPPSPTGRAALRALVMRLHSLRCRLSLHKQLPPLLAATCLRAGPAHRPRALSCVSPPSLSTVLYSAFLLQSSTPFPPPPFLVHAENAGASRHTSTTTLENLVDTALKPFRQRAATYSDLVIGSDNEGTNEIDERLLDSKANDAGDNRGLSACNSTTACSLLLTLLTHDAIALTGPYSQDVVRSRLTAPAECAELRVAVATAALLSLVLGSGHAAGVALSTLEVCSALLLNITAILHL